MIRKHCKKCHKILLGNEEGWGIEADGTKNPDYCYHCYKRGKISTLRIDEAYLKERINKMRQEINDLLNKIGEKKEN